MNKLDTDEHEAEEDAFKPLTREEAQRFRQQYISVSPWSVLAGQLLVGIVVALVAWAVTGLQNAGWSAFYGALAVVVPGAVFARGMTRKVSTTNPGTAVTGFFMWEMVKIGLTVAMLVAAPRAVLDLSWLAMLAGFVVTMKVYWLAMWLRWVRPNRQKILN